MSSLFDFIRRFAEAFIWWTVIQPWEGAIRVRLGKQVKLLKGGVHFKIPYVDSIYRQTIRLRYCHVGVQTVTTRDGKTITLSSSIGYKIADIATLYNTMHHAEETIRQLAMSEIACYVQEHVLLECRPAIIEGVTSKSINLEKYGIATDGICIVNFAVVKTYRLISDQHYSTNSDYLDTSKRDSTTTGGMP